MSWSPTKRGLQRFEPAADDDYAAVDGAQRALARLEEVTEDARGYAAHAKAPNTLKAYRIDWADFPSGARCTASSSCPPSRRRWRCI
ncbi:MAG: hypothetical protein M3069_16210 [Chloroflexota bacterium]|nr:hypothetical protein [Chloroflexota bacterium]